MGTRIRRSTQPSHVTIVRADPFRCCIWELHDRLEEYITEETCKSEIESFLANGQYVPALGRPLRGDPDHDIELIYGLRRLFVARYLNIPLLVELRELSDTEAVIAMDIENRQRLDVSPYERARSYSRWLASGFFASQDQLAKTFKISPAQVSRLMQLAKLPAIVVGAFASPSDLREEWGLSLREALSDERARRSVIQAARSISRLQPRPPAREVWRTLIAAAAGKPTLRSRMHEEVVRNDDGRVLFRIRRRSSLVTILLAREFVSAQCLKEIEDTIASVLDIHRKQTVIADSRQAEWQPVLLPSGGRCSGDLPAACAEATATTPSG